MPEDGLRIEKSAMIYLRCNALAWHQTRRLNVQPKLPEAIDRREANVGAIAFSRGGVPNVGEFKEAVILKTFSEAPTILNGSDAHVTRRKGEYSKSRLDREFPDQVMLPAERCLGVKGVAIQKFSRI
jgi:hypothetical protein